MPPSLYRRSGALWALRQLERLTASEDQWGRKSRPTAAAPKPTPVKHTTAKVTSASPKTGDEMNLVVLGCLLGISLLGLIALTVVFCWNRKRS